MPLTRLFPCHVYGDYSSQEEAPSYGKVKELVCVPPYLKNREIFYPYYTTLKRLSPLDCSSKMKLSDQVLHN